MILLLAACLPDVGVVTMYGIVHDAPNSEGNLVEAATVETRDYDGEVVGTAQTDFAGNFAVDVPEGVDFFVEVRKDGHVPTHFSGLAGVYDFDAGAGYPWVAPTAWVDGVREDFANCPTVDLPGGVVTGEVRLYISNIDPSGAPLIETGEVSVYTTASDEILWACYLDDEGNSIADGTQTGATGRFAVFGIPAGLMAVEVLYTDPTGDRVSSHPQYIVAEGGLVPMYPAWAYTTEG